MCYKYDMYHTRRCSYSMCTHTVGWDKRPSELDVLLQITQNNNKQNGDMYNRHDTHRISSKINREIFLKNFWPLKFEIWIWNHDR